MDITVTLSFCNEIITCFNTLSHSSDCIPLISVCPIFATNRNDLTYPPLFLPYDQQQLLLRMCFSCECISVQKREWSSRQEHWMDLMNYSPNCSGVGWKVGGSGNRLEGRGGGGGGWEVVRARMADTIYDLYFPHQASGSP